VYTVTGGGADIWNTSDQFNYLYKSYNGNGTLIARVTGIPNVPAAGGWSKAALMWRNSTSAGDVFVDVLVSYANGIAMQYRSSSGGSAGQTSGASGGAPTWIELVRNGSSFSGYYSTSTSMPTSWTLIGTQSITNMSTSALVGIALTSHDQGTGTTDTLSNVQLTGSYQTPAVAIAAATSPQTITAGGTANLSVLGVDDAGAAGLTYTWAATPASGVNFSANASNAAANTTATFTSPGLYSLVVTIKNAGNLTTTSTVNVNVLPTWLSATSIAWWNPTTSVLTVAGPTTVNADPGSAEPIVDASGTSALVTLNPSGGTDIHLGGLTLTDGASATVTSLGTARSVSNYRLLAIGTANATVTPTFVVDSTSTLDLADNDMAILYGSGTSPLSSVSSEISQAYDGGLWDQPGVTSSIAKTSAGATALGYGEAAASGLSTFDGLTLGANAVLVKYTLPGDTQLRGTVGIGDYNAVLNNFGAVQGWIGGNFHYGGVVSIGDYNAVLNNFGKTLADELPGGLSPALATASTGVTSGTTTSAVTPAVHASAQRKVHGRTKHKAKLAASAHAR
jgi:hypothetical protein